MYSRILVPFDGSETSTRGLDEAIRIASKTGASLRIVHLIDELRYITGFVSYQAYANEVVPFMRSEGAKILLAGRSRAERAGVRVETSLVEGVALHLCDVVIDQVRAWGANLIVIGTHGRHGVSRWILGSRTPWVVLTKDWLVAQRTGRSRRYPQIARCRLPSPADPRARRRLAAARSAHREEVLRSETQLLLRRRVGWSGDVGGSQSAWPVPQ